MQKRIIPLLVVFVIAVLACEPVNLTSVPPTNPPQAGATRTPTQPPTPVTDVDADISVFFTDPEAPGASSYSGGPDEVLAQAIDAALLSVDVAAYSLSLWSIRDALLRAEERGVIVRIVMESDNMDDEEVHQLIAAGIPVLGDRHEGLMHNKFIILDRREVWTGSMNYTLGVYYDRNNLVRIRSTELAANYTHEFEEMFLRDRFGGDSLADTPLSTLDVGEIKVQNYFSPDDSVADKIVDLIEGAQESIRFMAFSFTSDEIGTAIRERYSQGILVSGVMDADQAYSNEGGEYEYFQGEGMDVLLDGGEGLLHHKVIIIDESIVITGSYNFTNSAETRNDENVIILFSPQAADLFLLEFDQVYSQAQP